MPIGAEYFEKGKSIKGVKVNGEEWLILEETRPGVYQIVKAHLTDTIGVPGENEKLLLRFDKENKTMILKRAKLEYEIKVGFV